MVRVILETHPDAAREKGLDGWLPLQWALARQHPGAVVLAILEARGQQEIVCIGYLHVVDRIACIGYLHVVDRIVCIGYFARSNYD